MLALILAWVASAYSIEIQNETYSCGLTHWVVVRIPLHFNFSTSCKEEWTEFPKKTLIALVGTPSKPQCHLPCVKVSHREIILNECLQVKLVVICDDGIKTWETRIVFHGFYYMPLIVVLAVVFLHFKKKDINPRYERTLCKWSSFSMCRQMKGEHANCTSEQPCSPIV